MHEFVAELKVADDLDLPEKLFIFPLYNRVFFPGSVHPVPVADGPLREAVRLAQNHSDYLAFIPCDGADDGALPAVERLASVGTVGRLMKVAPDGDGGHTLIVHALKRIRPTKFLKSDRLIAEVDYIEDETEKSSEVEALQRNIFRAVTKLVELSPLINKELAAHILTINDPGRLTDLVAGHLPMERGYRIAVLEEHRVISRLELVYTELVREMDLYELGQKIHLQIRERIEESQREFFLREQLKAIRQELGEERDEKGLDIDKYEARIVEAKMPKEAAERANEQLERLRLLPPDAAEYNVIRTYLDWLVDLPWSALSDDDLDLENAERILHRDHFGLDDIKERIVEYLAVKKLSPNHQGQILCFVGAPGVGKTSLGRSIADALGREFFRFSLGGMRDEAEIKGHRRTYIGAMPGKIIQGLKRVKTRNPVFVLDEIDKLGSDWRGDPSSAMLEVLDPQQNHAFLDHYLDVPFDLSDVMFIATANEVSTIPRPLLDRMELISLAGYIEEEKLQIARRYLVPRQRKEHGLTAKQISLSDGAIRRIVRGYTREAGVRNLDQKIARVCRKAAVRIAKGDHSKLSVGVKNLHEVLGAPLVVDEVLRRGEAPGIAVGLAWTSAGGDVLFVECTKMPGRPRLKITGKLGEVMSESVQIAFSYVRANAEALGLESDAFDGEFHIHFPDGATPKDGPSAGVTIVTSILSLLRDTPMAARTAMSGEITLAGKVLPVGGIREKVTAARRAGARRVVLPEHNRRDVAEIPAYLIEGVEIVYAKTWHDVDDVVL